MVRSMVQRQVAVPFVALLMVPAVSAAGLQTAESTQLYTCEERTSVNVPDVGVTVCDATATAELERRAATDNLQSREGALVVELDAAGVSSQAGLQSGDVIYRVGGVDVASAESAAAALALIGSGSDTIVNFLRGGRPYRVKLRRN